MGPEARINGEGRTRFLLLGRDGVDRVLVYTAFRAVENTNPHLSADVRVRESCLPRLRRWMGDIWSDSVWPRLVRSSCTETYGPQITYLLKLLFISNSPPSMTPVSSNSLFHVANGLFPSLPLSLCGWKETY